MGLIDGAFGRAVAAGVGGAAGAGGAMMGMQIKMDMEEEKQRRIAEYASGLRRQDTVHGEETKREFAARDAETVTKGAEAIASKRSGLLSRGARDAYTNSGMPQDQIDAGLGAVQEAEQAGRYAQEPTTDDRFFAARKAGVINEKEALGIEHLQSKEVRDERRLDITAARDALKEKLAERRLDLDEKRINAIIAKKGTGAASAFVQFMKEMDTRFPKMTDEEKLKKWETAKAAPEQWTETEETEDVATGKTTKVVRKGSGSGPSGKPAPAGNDPLGIRKK